MLSVSDALEKPRLLQVLTGLTPEEFRDLTPAFVHMLEEDTRLNWRGQPRQRAKGAGAKGELAVAEQKLFFILYYLRHYPIQEVLGAHFGFDQSQANRWIGRLLPVLRRALKQHLALPHRRTAGLDKVLTDCARERVFLDGTDRPVRRPKDPEKQKDCYSGRKKRHTVKNLILTQERTVKYLSPTAPGRRTDKRLAEPLETVAFPAKSLVLADLGFLGLGLPNATLAQPAKKPKGRELSESNKIFNRLIARARVCVEHVIGSIKRARIVSDTFRHLKDGWEDLVMEVACGLHNFREQHRRGAGQVLAPVQLN